MVFILMIVNLYHLLNTDIKSFIKIRRQNISFKKVDDAIFFKEYFDKVKTQVETHVYTKM